MIQKDIGKLFIHAIMYLLAINQALPYGCSFVTYGHPEGTAAGDIAIIWNVFKQSVDCAHPFPKFIYFLLSSPSHGVPSFLGFENLFTIFPSVCMVFWYTIPFACLLFVLPLDFRSCTGLVSGIKFHK